MSALPSALPVAPAAVFQTKKESIYRALRDDILTCRRPPGQRLIIDELARHFGVSPIPVREALQTLEAERLVDFKPHAGSVVAAISAESVREIFGLIEGLELVAARAALERPLQLAPLAVTLAKMEQLPAAGSAAKWAKLNREFHEGISDQSHMPMLRQMIGHTLDHWDRIRRFFYRDQAIQDRVEAHAEHRLILAALQAGDEETLTTIIGAHNRRACAIYLAASTTRA